MESEIIIRPPTPDDGATIWQLVKSTGRLDMNSAYLYLLLSRDFADTCRVAEHGGKVVGFVSGYRPPGRPDVIFLWQIGVAPGYQGKGLGRRLATALLNSPGARGARYLESTVTPSNKPSQALFRGLARDLGVACCVEYGFHAEQFPDAGHEEETLYRVGPLDAAAQARMCA